MQEHYTFLLPQTMAFTWYKKHKESPHSWGQVTDSDSRKVPPGTTMFNKLLHIGSQRGGHQGGILVHWEHRFGP